MRRTSAEVRLKPEATEADGRRWSSFDRAQEGVPRRRRQAYGRDRGQYKYASESSTRNLDLMDRVRLVGLQALRQARIDAHVALSHRPAVLTLKGHCRSVRVSEARLSGMNALHREQRKEYEPDYEAKTGRGNSHEYIVRAWKEAGRR